MTARSLLRASAITLGGCLSLAAVAQEPVLVAQVDGPIQNPKVSPDGRVVVFEMSDAAGRSRLYATVLDEPGSEVVGVNLPGATSEAGGVDVEDPVWHPEGLVVFAASIHAGPSRIYFWQPSVQDLAESAGVSELLSSSWISGQLTHPCLTPDGQLIAFVVTRDGTSDVYAWSRSIHAMWRLTDDGREKSGLTFAPDGSHLAFESPSDEGDMDLWTIAMPSALPAPVVPIEKGAKKKKRPEPVSHEDGPPPTVNAIRIAEKRVGGPGEQVHPSRVGDDVFLLTTGASEVQWDLARAKPDGTLTTVATDVRRPTTGPAAVAAGGDWIAWTTADDDAIFLERPDGSKSHAVATHLGNPRDPTFAQRAGRSLVVFAATSAGGSQEGLYAVDITSVVGE